MQVSYDNIFEDIARIAEYSIRYTCLNIGEFEKKMSLSDEGMNLLKAYDKSSGPIFYSLSVWFVMFMVSAKSLDHKEGFQRSCDGFSKTFSRAKFRETDHVLLSHCGAILQEDHKVSTGSLTPQILLKSHIVSEDAHPRIKNIALAIDPHLGFPEISYEDLSAP